MHGKVKCVLYLLQDLLSISPLGFKGCSKACGTCLQVFSSLWIETQVQLAVFMYGTLFDGDHLGDNSRQNDDSVLQI